MVQVRFRFGFVVPIVPSSIERISSRRRNVEDRRAIPRAGFQQQHRTLRSFRKACGDNRARASRSNDDIVEFFHGQIPALTPFAL